MAIKQLDRRDTAAGWTTVNPVLSAGERALETDTGKRKYGDGTTAWTSLAYLDAPVQSQLNALSAYLDFREIEAPAFSIRAGAPSLATPSGVQAWQFADGVIASIMATITLPSSWSTFDAWVYWSVAAVTAGDVVWTMHPNGFFGVGDVLTTPTGGSNVTGVGVATSGQMVRTKALTGVTNQAGKMFVAYLQRQGTHASDTLTTFANMAKVRFEKVT